MTALYNENDPYCADWLERLIDAGRIAPGVVDRRSILDISPADLAGYTQVHFFAGIGIFSAALREAGWSDDWPIWTGSCPCQPFSAAGQRGGFADERHLWPYMHHLIRVCRPAIVTGEQVASPDGLRWLDLVQDDMEGTGYAFGAVDTCAAGACVDFAESEEGEATLEWIRGAVLHCPDPFLASELSDFAAWAGSNLGYGPAHIRQRLYWVADANGRDASEKREQRSWQQRQQPQDGGIDTVAARPVADADQGQRGRFADREERERDGQAPGRQQGHGIAQSSLSARALADAEPQHNGCGASGPRRRVEFADGSAGVGLADTYDTRLPERRSDGRIQRETLERPARQATERGQPACSSDWIICTDGKARPSQPGVLPLVDAWSRSSRVAVLRAAGNSLNKAQAVQFIRSIM